MEKESVLPMSFAMVCTTDKVKCLIISVDLRHDQPRYRRGK